MRFEGLRGVDLGADYSSPRVAGDFFDAIVAGPRVILLLCDVAGDRAIAQSIAACVQKAFRATAPVLFCEEGANESIAITSLLHELNRALMVASHGVRCTPAFLGCYNMTLGILTYINAGGQPPALRDSGGTVLLESGGVPLGLFSHITHEPVIQLLEPGARLVVVTKGVVESRGRGEEFGLERLRQIVAKSDGRTAAAVCSEVVKTADAFRKQRSLLDKALSASRLRENFDDLTCVALARRQV